MITAERVHSFIDKIKKEREETGKENLSRGRGREIRRERREGRGKLDGD